MKKVIKHPKKMKNAMYIVFGVFALALFAITRIHPSYANDGLMIDDALDAIVLYGEVEQLPEAEEVEGVQGEEIQEIEQNQEVEEYEDIVEPGETTGEKTKEENEISDDLEEIVLERDNKEIDKTENKEEPQVNEGNHGVSNENMNNEKGKQEQNIIKEGNNLNLDSETAINTLGDSVEMNDQLKSINFTWDEIIVPNPDNVHSGIIIMDRNLGATVAGTGEGSYGFFYQWGNNYGFADTGAVEGTTTLATWSGDYSHRGYYGNKFISTSNYDYWSDNNAHNDLWGGESDTKDNNRGYDTISETVENRQGPCPEGWHVPSIGEWSKLVNFWFDYNHKNGYNEPKRLYRYTNYNGLTHLEGEIAPNLMRNDLLIPWAGLRYNSSNSSYQNESYGYGYYFSSTPSIYLYIYKQGFNPDQSLYNHINGYSVRCFKNVYDPEIFTISFDTNGGHDYENKLIAKGNKLILDTDPMKFGSTFEGWYKDENFNELYDFNTPVTESFTLYAKWNDSFGIISISDPDNPLSGFTIMNKNLGAKNNGTGEDAFGYYYQWGNNHGFSTIRSYTTTLAEWNDDYEHEGYYGTQFVSKYGSYWLDGQEHPSLWGGENDNYSNNYGLDNISETAENRQGPCPEGYHIPSAGEWSKLVDYWKKSYTYENNVVLNLDSNMDSEKKKASEFINYFELPLQYNYEPYQESYDIVRRNMRLNDGYTPIYGYYRSSTPSGSSSYDLTIYDKGIYPTNTYSNYRGQNIRCFSNEYRQEGGYTLTLYTNSGGFVDIREIRGNHKLTGLPNLTREHSVLEGWYQDKNHTEMNYDFNRIVDGDLTFYAKWSCDYGYQMSDDGQSCEPISVKFNANGGKFTNNESIMIKNSYLKEVSSEITEIRHTSNILDDGTQSGAYSDNNRVDVVTIPGAKKLHIILKWGFEGHSSEGMRVWTGAHPDYTPQSHSDTAIEFDGETRLRGPSLKVEKFDIDGDSVSFGIKTDAYKYNGIQYGYHVIVAKDAEYEIEYQNGIFDNIEEPIRDGYTFKGWYFDNETFNHNFNSSEVTTGESMNVYAKWQANVYTVSFNADNGETNPGNITVTYDSQYPELSVVNKTGYTFLGWYNGEEKINSGDVAQITGDVVLKAKRTINQYKIIFDTDGGNEINSIDVDYNSLLTGINLPIPTKECNDFSRWDVELPETMPAHDITLKAIWNYTCSRSSGGGGGAKKLESTTREIAIDTPTEQEHNSANEEQKSEISSNPENTKEQEIGQEIVIDGGTQKTVAVKNTEIVATVRNTTHSSSSRFTKEQNDAYSFAKSNGITTTSSIEDAKMNTELTRIQMAKMLSNFAINVLGQEPDPEKGIVKFNDVTNKMDKQYDNAVTKAYQLGIMGQNMKNNEFRPSDTVTRAEFASALSRLLYQTEEGEYKGTGKYYIPHVSKLYNEGIINKADPKIKEKRGYVMTMLMRTVK